MVLCLRLLMVDRRTGYLSDRVGISTHPASTAREGPQLSGLRVTQPEHPNHFLALRLSGFFLWVPLCSCARTHSSV